MFLGPWPMFKFLLLNILLLGMVFGQKEPDYKLNKKGQAVPTFLGRIIMLKGTVSRVEGNGKMVALKEQSKIKKNQVIATGKSSFVKIKLVDQSIFTMSSFSRINFKDFNYKSPKDRTGLFNLLKGKLRASIPVKSKRDSLKIISGAASMGIRGTKVLVNNRTDDLGNNVVQMALLEGDVVIKNSLTKEEKNLKPGDHLIFVQDKNSKEALNKVDELEEKVVEELKNIDDEEKKVLPFLPFYDYRGNNLEKKVTFKVVKLKNLKSSEGENSKISTLNKKNKEKKVKENLKYSWKNVLRKLNKILRDNRVSK
ncbi:MAG: hypothetical protein CME68_09485 [Halobacteriovoraceae bacterium]|nr:hypothetical protein [Halobacteriovoraceae bacterium]